MRSVLCVVPEEVYYEAIVVCVCGVQRSYVREKERESEREREIHIYNTPQLATHNIFLHYRHTIGAEDVV